MITRKPNEEISQNTSSNKNRIDYYETIPQNIRTIIPKTHRNLRKAIEVFEGGSEAKKHNIHTIEPFLQINIFLIASGIRCRGCGMRISSSLNLKSHMKIHHNDLGDQKKVPYTFMRDSGGASIFQNSWRLVGSACDKNKMYLPENNSLSPHLTILSNPPDAESKN